MRRENMSFFNKKEEYRNLPDGEILLAWEDKPRKTMRGRIYSNRVEAFIDGMGTTVLPFSSIKYLKLKGASMFNE